MALDISKSASFFLVCSSTTLNKVFEVEAGLGLKVLRTYACELELSAIYVTACLGVFAPMNKVS